MKSNLESNSVDVVVTSPPYNIGINYNTYKDDLPRKDYLNQLKQVSLEIKRVLKDNGSYFLNVGNKPKDQWIAWDVASMLREDFVLQNVIHWIKSIAINKPEVKGSSNTIGDVAVGHFKPIVSNRFLNDCHEYIFHFTKEGNTVLDKLSEAYSLIFLLLTISRSSVNVQLYNIPPFWYLFTILLENECLIS